MTIEKQRQLARASFKQRLEDLLTFPGSWYDVSLLDLFERRQKLPRFPILVDMAAAAAQDGFIDRDLGRAWADSLLTSSLTGQSATREFRA